MGNGPTKEEKDITEKATQETKLECPVLVDLGHGTVRHRHEEMVKDEQNNNKLKIGYFYHPRLNDFSEDAEPTSDDCNRLKYVFKGPSKDSGKKLYYIYGTRASDIDDGLCKKDYKPQGIGYNWPDSYRKASHLYYEVSLCQQDEKHEKNVDEVDINGNFENLSPTNKDDFSLTVEGKDFVCDVIEHISLQILVPSSNIHLLVDKSEIDADDNIINHFSTENGEKIKLHLRLV